MLDNKTETLIAVAEQKNFTRAAEALSLTQPAVSHQISQLEQSLGAKLFNRKKGELTLTQEGEIAVRYARILTSMDQKMHMEIADSKRNIKNLRIGLTHTSESTFATEVLARYGNEYPNVSITVFTDTIKNLYDMLDNFEIDLAITDGKVSNPSLNSVMIDTDYLVCIMSNNNPLAKHSMITLNELRRERLILRLPTSATRMLFEATLESHNEKRSCEEGLRRVYPRKERVPQRSPKEEADDSPDRKPQHGARDEYSLSQELRPYRGAPGYNSALSRHEKALSCVNINRSLHSIVLHLIISSANKTPPVSFYALPAAFECFATVETPRFYRG